MIEIKLIGNERKEDINIPNQPFSLFGRLIPAYTDGQWTYSAERYPAEKISEMCFPDENYDYDSLAADCVFVGAYDGARCVGLAILRQAPLKYMYLYDFKVNKAYRGRHVGKLLIDKCKQIAVARGYCGLYTQGQDNNLGACLFYLNNGFEIGGLDTAVYKGTAQEGKRDIIFYCDAE